MKDSHLTPEDLEPLFEEGNEKIRNRIFLHHLAICPECHAVAGYVLDAYLAGEVGLDLCSVDIDLARSRREAPALWEELRQEPFDVQKTLVESDDRFKSWGLAEWLCHQSKETATTEPAAAIRIAELAVAVSMALKDWCPTDDGWLCLLRGYAWVHLAACHRVAGDLQAAAKTFATAEKWWGPAFANTGDVLDYEAGYLCLKASLLRETRRFNKQSGDRI